MTNFNRLVIKITGESGQGINSIGEIVAKSLKKSGYYSFGYREYPSLIKGGYAFHQIDFSGQSVNAPSKWTDVLLCFSRVSFHAYLPTLKDGGQVIHMLSQLDLSEEEEAIVSRRKIKIAYLPAETQAVEAGGTPIMANVVMIAALWQLLGLSLELLSKVVGREFAHKRDVIKPNLACLEKGYVFNLENLKPLKITFLRQSKRSNDALLSGNHLLSLGSLAAGVRAYFAYPMTPSSSILTYQANIYHETGILVKQVDDEISVAQMAIGAMFMGTRALVATSGGGFDLMTESVSLAGMTETPFVCILAQRPGPSTGLPTWTAASDLNLAVYGGHGEFTRCVIAISDPQSAYLVIQNAFNLAEKYQIPVIVLTEKQIAESLFQIADLPNDVGIERHLVPKNELTFLRGDDRYKFTKSGISPRWLPGQSEAVFAGNSDEHIEDGSLTEEAEASKNMYEKRLAKKDALMSEIPEPDLIGPEDAVLTLVGWGSVRNTACDVMRLWNEANSKKRVNFLHYKYIYPVKIEKLESMISQKKRMVLVENNAFGQLGALLTQETGFQFKDKLLKFDGRPFFVEDLYDYLEKVLKT